jgi:fibronectin-binding autotransporter adhesin
VPARVGKSWAASTQSTRPALSPRWSLNGGVTVAGNVATLTTAAGNEARSLFSNTPVSVPAGTGGFTYQATGGTNPPADGFAFVLQNQGVTAVGGAGGGKGYAGLTPSVGLLFNIYTAGGGVVGTSLQTNGASPADSTYTSCAPVNLGSGNPINVTLTYNAATTILTVALAEQNTANTYTTNLTINLGSVLGNAATLGFTGGTNANQTISNFSYAATVPAPTLTVQGTGTLTLSGANINSGGVTLNFTAGGGAGVLAVTSGAALGTGTLTLTGGVLQNAGPGLVSFTNPVSLGGPNPVTFAGNNTTFLGTAILTANAVLAATNKTTFAGVLSGTGFGLTLSSTPVVTAGGTLLNTGTLLLTNAETYTGSTTINAGTLVLGGGGSLRNTAGVTVNNGGTLTLDNTGTSSARLTNVPLTLDGGIFNFDGSAGGAESETLGQLVLGSGQSVINSDPTVGGGSGTAALQFAPASGPALTRVPGATVNFTGTGVGSANNTVTFTGTPALNTTLVNGILPYAYVNGADFATVSSGGVISAFGGYVAMPANGGTGAENVQLTGNTTVSQNTTINSLKLAGNIVLTLLPGVTLTIGSGGVLITGATGAGAAITGGTLVFTSEAIIRTDATNGTSGATISSTISAGGNAVTITGGGTLTLPNANSYSGTTTINGGLVGSAPGGGTVILGNPLALGTGPLTLNGGALQTSLTGGLTLANNVTFNNSTVSLGSKPMLFTGTVNLGGAGTNATLNNSALAAFDDIVSGAANLIKLGSGTLVLAGGSANTYTGVTTVGAGTVQLQKSSALSSTGAVVAGGATVAILENGLTNASPLTLYGSGVGGTGALRNMDAGSGTSNTWTGNVVLAAPSTITVDAGTTLTANTGVVSGPGDLTKLGAGTLVLSGANTYTGNTVVGTAGADGGFLQITSATALGANTGTVTVNNGPTSGATLQLNPGAAITVVGKTLNLNGSGQGTFWAQPYGALANIANFANVWSGNVNINSAGTWIMSSTGSLTINGVVSSSSGLNVANGTVTLNASNTFTGNVNVVAAALTLSNSNAYAGTTTVGGGAFNGTFQAGSLTLNGVGSALNSTGFNINQGGTLKLDNSVFNSTGWLGSSVPLTFNSGTFTFLANNNTGVSVSQALGSITLASGQSTINVGFAAVPVSGATSTVTFTQLTRNAGATANFIGGTGNVSPLGTANNQLLVNSGLTATNGSAGTFSGNGYQFFGTGNGGTMGNIIPFAEVNGPTATPTAGIGLLGDFATYTASGIAAFSNDVVQGISAAGGLVNNATSATDIVKVTATGGTAFTITAASNQVVGALLSANNATAQVNLASTGTLTVAGGALMTNGSNTANSVFSGGTITLPVETVLFQNLNTNGGTNNTQFATALTGPGSLVIGGTGNYHWNSGTGSTYTGGTVINSATNVYITTNTGAFGTGPLTLTGGQITPNINGTAVTFSNAVKLNGAVTLTGNAFLTANTGSGNGSVTFQGSIGETGGSRTVTVVGGGSSVVLNNANTFSGGFVMAGGNLLLGNNTALGTGTLTLVGGTTGTNLGSVILTNAVQITNSTLSIGLNNANSQGNNITFAGPTTLFGSNTLTIASEGLTTFQGAIGGSGALTLHPAGSNVGSMIELAGTNTFSGGVTIGSGSLVLTNASALGSGPLTVSPPLGQAPGPVVTGIGTTALTFANALNINGAGTFAGSTPLTFNGAVTLLAGSTATMNGTATVTLKSAVGESGGSRSLAVAGNGALALPSAAYYSGGFTLSPFTGSGILGSFYNLTYTPGNNNNYDYNIAPVFTRLDSVLWIDGNLVINSYGGKGITAVNSSAVTLSAGLHSVRLLYSQGTGGAALQLD